MCFFLGNESNPDEPDDESSRAPLGIVFTDVGTPRVACDIDVTGKLDGVLFSDTTLTVILLPKSSCDAIFLLFKLDVGLKIQRNKKFKFNLFFSIEKYINKK